MDCSICCEKFNKTFHSKVECKGCNETDVACRTCCQTYITTNSSQEASCMFCKTTWDRDFMNENLTKKFVANELKAHSENILMEQQISLLPATQPAAIVQKRLNELRIQIELAIAHRKLLKQQDREQRELIQAFQLEIARLHDGTSTDDSNKSVNFTVKCPLDNCNGFLDSKYVCMMCDTKICKDCMEKKGEDHQCDEDLKNTVKAIRKDSKPCPSCGENISKIDGCDHMWCVSCHKQFSWRTGAIIQGSNHNPEYFRWMRETGQSIRPSETGRQVVCGVEITDRSVYDIMTKIFPTHDTLHAIFNCVYRLYRHIQWNVRQVETYREPMYQRELEQLRVRYLLNKIDKQDWKKTLQKMNKRNSKDVAYHNIWKLAETVFGSMIEEIISNDQNNSTPIEYVKIAKTALKFKQYINEQFIKTLNTFGATSCPGISTGWRETPNYKAYQKEQLNHDEAAANAGLQNGEPHVYPRRNTDEWTLIYLNKIESMWLPGRCVTLTDYDPADLATTLEIGQRLLGV